MLVTVAVLVIIMTILVQIFQAATGALTAAQTIQELDNQLKLLDSTIRSDLGGVTARFTPPLNPALNLGYFEYGENEFADSQGEDSDDYLRFTAKAPPGQPFTGRLFLPPWIAFANMTAAQLQIYLSTQPVTVTSEYAEIIYFVRNGNLYRRVLLVAPQLQSSLVQGVQGVNLAALAPNYLGTTVSWQGVNDLSARPAATGNVATANSPIVLNTLGDLTNRENRFAAPRFANDFVTPGAAGAQPIVTPDGFPDDLNGDKVPDYYPSLYAGVPSQLIFEPAFPANIFPAFRGLMGFPWVFPGAYSNPQHLAQDQYGWIHSPSPVAVDFNHNTYQFDKDPVHYLQFMNHNPLDLGDNLPTPQYLPNPVGFTQTWWGFPTWRETLSPAWNDPTRQVNDNTNFAQFGQPNGLSPRPASQVPVIDDGNLLPAMTNIWRLTPQLFTDGYGDMNGFFPAATLATGLWGSLSWEDDLVMTNVRSFDVKAFDNALAAYADLGWGDDVRFSTTVMTPAAAGSFLLGNADYSGFATAAYPPLVAIQGIPYIDYINLTFAHEGRMPPIVADQRLDAQSGLATNYLPAGSPFLPPNGTYTGNVGDNNPGVVRLRRVWDTWSTEYSKAPATGLNVAANGFPVGPMTQFPPVYPSYPPPYPAALRGIQIQIRVADPTNQRIKSLTIRQDFTDKL